MGTSQLITLAALVAAAVLAVNPGRGRAGFLLMLSVALVAGRWEALSDNRPWANPDEGHMISGAATLARDPVPWGSVDGTTHGPVNLWPLTFAAWAGVTLDYRAARVLSVACLVGMLAFLLPVAAARGEAVGRLSLLPVAGWQALNPETELQQLCSEHVPLLLLGLAVWTALGVEPAAFSRRRAALLGAVLAMVPLAKLQGVPLALGVAIAWLIAIRGDGHRWPALGLAAGLGAAAAVLLVLGPTLAAGQAGEFWTSYIVANRNYAMTGPSTPPQPHLVWGLRVLFGLTGGLLGAGLVLDRRAVLRDPATLAGLLLGAAATVAIIVPGYMFRHYWLLMAPGLLLLAGPGLRVLAARGRFTTVSFVALGFALLAPFILRRLLPFARAEVHREFQPRVSEAALASIRAAGPSDASLAVWGWLPDLYVLSHRRQAVREAQTTAQIVPGPLQGYFRARFLADLERNRPAAFVDAVHPDGYAFHDRVLEGHESFPALHAWLVQSYQFAGDFDGLRVYRRIVP